VTRGASCERTTKETSIRIRLEVDGSGESDVSTGLPFFDHMIAQLGKHGGFDLAVEAEGDLDVDAHHTVEDVGIALGSVLADALGDKAGIRRFASISLPLDEALIDVVSPAPEPLGTPPFDPQLAEEFWRAFATSAGITLHIRQISGKNPHHVLEASFKGVARCLRDAVRVDGSAVPSTKGVL
jgi:imidazoleglycerol-phosphate dehydratase